jgi:serine/threonine protein kinase/WD40 repeat protein
VAGSSVISRLHGSEFRIDRICRRFEQAWREDRPLSIEHCLLEVESVDQQRLLEELIAIEWELRIRRNQVPVALEYLERFPDHQELVEAVCQVLQLEFAVPADKPVKPLPQEGDHLGDYRIIREIGRGGMGIVFEARQESLGRQVALKVLPARRFQNERELLRFRREAQSVARLHHSHIVEIYGVGEQEGVHYFAMRYIVGRSLDDVICELRSRLEISDAQLNVSVLDEPAAGRTSPSTIHTGSSLFLSRILSTPQDSIDSQHPAARYRAVARIGHQVAEALQYAHQRGILHRDVKPSNLLLDRQEVCWLSDFGLAKAQLEPSGITESNDLIGTMKYMSPEALDGTTDERSDLYSLGLTLYELATLRPVLNAADRVQLLEQVRDPHPAAPRRFAPEIPRDLETVILKAMAVDPNQRYRTAAELADDLERFLNHEPIKARPQSAWTKLRRWVERKPLLAFLALGTVSITATSLFSFVSLYFSARQTAFVARQERDRSYQLRFEAEEARTATEVSRKTAELLSIEAQKRLIQVQRSKAATRLKYGDDFGALVWTAETLQLLEQMAQPQRSANATALNSVKDKETQDATATNNLSISASDQSGHLQLEAGLRLRVGAIAEHAPRVLQRLWLPQVIQTWSSSATDQVDARRHSWDEDRIQFDQTGQYLILADREQTRQVRWDLSSGKFEANSHPEGRGRFVYTKSGEARIVWGLDRRLIYEPTDSHPDGKDQHGIDAPVASSSTAVFRRSDRRPDGDVRQSDAESPAPRVLASPPDPAATQPVAAWESPDRHYLLISFEVPNAAVAKDSAVVSWLWDLKSGQLANSAPLPFEGRAAQVEFNRGCDRVFVRSDRTVKILELPEWKQLLSNEEIDPKLAAWSHDGHWLATKSGSNTALYQINANIPHTPQWIESPGLRGIQFEEGGGGMALLMQRGHIAFLSIGDGQKAQFRDFSHPHETDIRSFNYSPDGQWYALAYNDGNVRVWSVHYNQPITGLMHHSSAVTSVAWSPGGDLLGTLTQDGLLTVWDARTCCATGQIFFHPKSRHLKSVRFSPDGTRIVASGPHEDPVAWNNPKGAQEVLTVPGTSQLKAFSPVQTAEGTRTKLSPDQQLAAVVQATGSISLFRAADSALIHTLPLREQQPPQDLVFNKQGTQLAAVGKYGLQVWDTLSGKELTQREEGPSNRLQSVCFSDDNRHLATVTENHICQIHDTSTWERSAATFQLESRPVLTRFNRRDQTFVTVTETGMLQIWDWTCGEPLTPPLRNIQPIQDADLSPDGTQVAVICDAAVRVWTLPRSDLRSVPEISAWARDVTLSEVNVNDETLIPFRPLQASMPLPVDLAERQANSPLSIAARIEWHLSQVNEAQLNRDAVAAKFHIERLRAVAPNYPEFAGLRQRLLELERDAK